MHPSGPSPDSPNADGATLLEQHLAALQAYVRVRLGRALRTKEESRDLVQSVCREVLTDFTRRDPGEPGRFREWLLHAAENKIRDRLRHWQRQKRDVAREVELDATRDGDRELSLQMAQLSSPSRDAIGREELARLEQAFARLPQDYRTAIVLARIEGLDHAQLAERLGRTPLATRSLLSRALARLALELEAGDAPPGPA
jgi:RNA polymerase sigma factor (sigma-70 family)